MSDSNRLLVVTLAGLAALVCAAGFGAFYGSVHAPQKRHYQSVGTNSGQAYPADSPRNGLADVAGIDSLAESIIAKPKPRTTDEREQRDLAAQESMAVFAYWMFWAMILQTGLAGGALVMLVKDLRQNRESAEAQLRAYVHVSAMQLRWPKVGGLETFLEFQNAGQSPAIALRAWIHTWAANFPLDIELPKPKPNEMEQSRSVLLPGAAHRFDQAHGADFNPLAIQAFENGTGAIYCYGEILYEDVFGRTHRSEFLHFCNGKQWKTVGAFNPYMTGNTMT